MWEVIRKNKYKSVIALAIMAVWYSIIYGIIFSIITYCVLGNIDEALTKMPFSFYVIFGIFVSFTVFAIKFGLMESKPYKIEGCRLYKINKKQNLQLCNIVEEVAIASGMKKIPNVYILNSNILNAYACGLTPNGASIVITKGLIEILTRDELQGVIAHEMSHIINRDITYLLCSGALYTISAGFTYGCFSLLRNGRNGKGAAVILLLGLISLIGQGVCFLLFMFVSRKREYLADACACQYTRYPKGLADALLKIETRYKNKKEYINNSEYADRLIKASFIVPVEEKDNLFSTHPATQNRIKILMNMKTADYIAYEQEFQRLNHKKLISKNTIKNTTKIEIKETEENIGLVAACELDKKISINDNEKRELRENRDILAKNIKRRREIEDIIKEQAGYIKIECECGTKMQIPPVYKNIVVICPHCQKKHIVK